MTLSEYITTNFPKLTAREKLAKYKAIHAKRKAVWENIHKHLEKQK